MHHSPRATHRATLAINIAAPAHSLRRIVDIGIM